MMKSNEWKIIASIAIIIIFASMASAYTLDRNIPSYVNPGEKFKVNYSIENPDSSMYVYWQDKNTGGCSPTIANDYMASSIITSKTYEFTAPTINGSCVFDGYYYFQDGITKNFPRFSIQVGTISTPAPVQNQTVQNYTYFPANYTAPATEKSGLSICSITEKFSFFGIINPCYEGAILLLIGIIMIYKVLK